MTMPNQSDDEYEVIVLGLSRLIRIARMALEYECTTPRPNPDASDAFISNERKRVQVLCDLRDRFEDIETSSSVPHP